MVTLHTQQQLLQPDQQVGAKDSADPPSNPWQSSMGLGACWPRATFWPWAGSAWRAQCAPVALALSYLQAQYHYAWPVCCAMLCQGLCPCIADCTSLQQQVLQTVPVLGCLSGQGGSTLWPYAVAGKVQVDELPAGRIR